jgi:T4 RnlA family RNA ligase
MLEKLNKYYEDELVQKQVHPTLPLTIWNYTPKVQYGEGNTQYKFWDDVTKQCRGLVTDNEGNVVARPFKKFFNIEENQHTPTEQFDVYEKMDGSLGILFNYKGEWVLATRGSFTSDQSVKGTELLQKYDYQRLNPNYTYLFEIIYPENRIVCTYDFEDLVLLGMIHTESGDEVNIHSGNNEDVRFKNLLNNLGFNIVRKYDGISDYTYLKHAISDNREGFVVRFSNGDRMKIKGEEYLRLHKIMTNLSTTGVWEVLSSGGKMEDYLKDVPDEFYKKVKQYVSTLNYHHYRYSEYAGKMHDYFRYGKYGDNEKEYTKKEFAEHLERNNVHPKVKSLCFAMWDGKPYDHIIWKYLKPKFEKL